MESWHLQISFYILVILWPDAWDFRQPCINSFPLLCKWGNTFHLQAEQDIKKQPGLCVWSSGYNASTDIYVSCWSAWVQTPKYRSPIMQTLGVNRWWLKELGSTAHMEELDWDPGFGLDIASTSHCGHLGNKPADGNLSCLSYKYLKKNKTQKSKPESIQLPIIHRMLYPSGLLQVDVRTCCK